MDESNGGTLILEMPWVMGGYVGGLARGIGAVLDCLAHGMSLSGLGCGPFGLGMAIGWETVVAEVRTRDTVDRLRQGSTAVAVMPKVAGPAHAAPRLAEWQCDAAARTGRPGRRGNRLGEPGRAAARRGGLARRGAAPEPSVRARLMRAWRQRLTSYAEPKLLALLLTIAACGWIFVSLADEVTEGETQGIDGALLLALRSPLIPRSK